MGTLSVDKLMKTSTGAAEFTLPATDGTAGQVWQTDGSGQLSSGNISGISVAATTLTASGATTLSGAFTSLGIDDNADAIAITIDSSENVGVGTTTPSTTLHAYKAGFPVIKAERFLASNTNAIRDVTAIQMTSDVNISDGFGPAIRFDYKDDTAEGLMGSFGVVRDGADGSGAFIFRPGVAGSTPEKWRMNSVGNMIFTGSGSVGIATVSSISNNAVTSFTPSSNRGIIYAGGDSTHMGAVGYVCKSGGTTETYLMMNSSGTFAVGTGVPTGTTGGTPKFTIFAANDGKIYFENRLGGGFAFWYFTMGLPW